MRAPKNKNRCVPAVVLIVAGVSMRLLTTQQQYSCTGDTCVERLNYIPVEYTKIGADELKAGICMAIRWSHQNNHPQGKLLLLHARRTQMYGAPREGHAVSAPIANAGVCLGPARALYR